MKRGIWGGNWTRLFALAVHGFKGRRRRAAFIEEEAGGEWREPPGSEGVHYLSVSNSHFYSTLLFHRLVSLFYCAIFSIIYLGAFIYYYNNYYFTPSVPN